jgi:single-strand DNA-binding protein
MASFNKVILLGNLTRDPQVRYTPSGMAVADVGLAVNHSWFDKNANQRREEVTFVDVTLWGRTAEIAGEYLSKGRQVLIEGRLRLDQWDDKQTGQKRSKLCVVCENMTMLGGRQEGGRGPSASPSTSDDPGVGFENQDMDRGDGFEPGPPASAGGDSVPF